MALPLSMRFLNRRGIQRVLRLGRRFYTPLGRAFVTPAAYRGGRTLFIISSAASRKSSGRNRAKRRLDEWARKNLPEIIRHRDIVVLVSREAANCPRSELYKRAEEFGSRLQALLK